MADTDDLPHASVHLVHNDAFIDHALCVRQVRCFVYLNHMDSAVGCPESRICSLLPIAAPSASSSRPLSSFMVCSSRSSRRPSPSTRDSGPGQVRRRYDPHNLLLRAAAASNILPQEGERAYCRQKPLAATNLLGLHAAQSQGIDCSAQQHQLYLSVHSNIGLARRAKPLDNAGTDFETRIPVAKPRPAARTRSPKAPDA